MLSTKCPVWRERLEYFSHYSKDPSLWHLVEFHACLSPQRAKTCYFSQTYLQHQLILIGCLATGIDISYTALVGFQPGELTDPTTQLQLSFCLPTQNQRPLLFLFYNTGHIFVASKIYSSLNATVHNLIYPYLLTKYLL